MSKYLAGNELRTVNRATLLISVLLSIPLHAIKNGGTNTKGRHLIDFININEL